ncbi:MAG: hypothetical protein EA402_09930 [Planctomycetota bacterium]|nr:MAG: hypothetical protein EA402_09930 [Planctomycetota bacterium]
MSTILYLGLWANPPYDCLSDRFAHLAEDIQAAGLHFGLAHYHQQGLAENPEALHALLDGVDGVILSGSRHNLPLCQEGEGTEDEDAVRFAAFVPLLKALQERPLPVLGICFGHQLLALAEGCRLGRLLAKRRASDHPVTFQGRHPLMHGLHTPAPGASTIYVPENHRMIVEDVDPQRWHILAQSIDGIEAIEHRTLPWIGLQFHPEYHPESSSGDARRVLLNWLSLVRPRLQAVV